MSQQLILKDKVLAGIDSLPSLSPAVQDIIVVSNDVTSTPKDLLEIIRKDPVLTVKILKLVNSAYFSLSNRVVSLNRALVLLGFNTIKNIAISSELVKFSESSPKNPYFQYHELWEHMVSVGATSKLMAKASGEERKNLEEYFIAGLIHDLGDFMMMRFVPKEFHRIREFALDKNMSVKECSQQVLGFSSGEMGGELARQWKLQDHLQRIIINVGEEDDEAEKLDKVVSIADKFCRQNEVGYVNDRTRLDILSEDLVAVGLKESFFEDYGPEMFDSINKAKVFIN
jgi:HD-like signal output (HDOD) protein